MTKEEKIALDKVKSSLTHNGNRYSIAVPWKEDNLVLPNNREMAKKRLESTERSLNTKGAFVKQQYEETIKSYVEKGYLRKFSPDERWYLRHFPIVKLDKSMTKVRIVFDCSAKYDGVVLNDVHSCRSKTNYLMCWCGFGEIQLDWPVTLKRCIYELRSEKRSFIFSNLMARQRDPSRA